MTVLSRFRFFVTFVLSLITIYLFLSILLVIISMKLPAIINVIYKLLWVL